MMSWEKRGRARKWKCAKTVGWSGRSTKPDELRNEPEAKKSGVSKGRAIRAKMPLQCEGCDDGAVVQWIMFVGRHALTEL